MVTLPGILSWLTALAAIGAGLTVAASVIALAKRRARQAATQARARYLARWIKAEQMGRQRGKTGGLPQLVARLGALTRHTASVRGLADRLLPRSLVDANTTSLTRAGLRDQIDPLDLCSGECVVAVILTGLYLFALGQGSVLDLGGIGMMALLAYIVPKSVLDRATRARQSAVRAALPAAIDILAVAVTGGATLDAAVDLYCQRFSGPLMEELRFTRQEMALGRSRRDALMAMAERCEVEPVRSLLGAVLQGERFGTPIGQTLRAQSRDIKTQRRQWVQEQLAKAPVKMMLPLAGFVLPALLIILLGPAALQFFAGN